MIRALHRLIRRPLPRDFRERFGPDMEEVFVEAHEDARRRGAAVLRLWLREAVDLAVTGRRLRVDRRRFGAGFVALAAARGWTRGRGGWTMGIRDDVRYAVRSLVRRPALTLWAGLTLALGIGATTAIFSTLESVVINPLPYDHGERMVGIFKRLGNASAFVTPSAGDVERWSAQDDLFERLEPWTFRTMTLTGQGDPREAQVTHVRPSFFELLGRTPALGRLFDEREAAVDDPTVVVVSDGFWRRELGGSPEALGRTIRLNGIPRTVIGVLPPRTLVPGWGLRPVDAWLPLGPELAAAPNPATALLREGVTVERANARLVELDAESAGSLGAVGHARLVSEQVGAAVRDHLALLMGAVVLLLLIACVNVSNLLLFRANARKRETAVRSALGGGRGRLTRQLLIESLVLALGGGLLGVALSYVGQVGILQLRPAQLEVLDHVSINASVLLFALGVTVATGLLFGALPAWTVGHAKALEGLRTGVRSEGDVLGRRVRWVLVAGEVALSFALLMGSISVLSTLLERSRTDYGFAADEIAVMELTAPEWRYASRAEQRPLLEAIEERLAGLPGVAHVTRSSGVPPRAGVWFGNLQVEGEDPSEETTMLFGPHVEPGYFETLGQEIVRGRAFSEEDGPDQSVVIVGEETARTFFGDRDPLGARFRMGEDDDWMTVVGVAADVPMNGLGAATAPPQFYQPLPEDWSASTFLVRVATGRDPGGLLPTMRDIVEDVEPEMRVDQLAVASALMQGTLERERFATTLMGTLAALALVLAAVGLYGVVSQVVGQRTREIGIRIALGARRASVAGSVLRRVGVATAVGIVAGVGLALLASRVLEWQVYGIEVDDGRTWVLAALALGLTSLVAAYAPARRASRVDPMQAMRVE